jgi:adenosylcobinamide-GDP ribazoletransferase
VTGSESLTPQAQGRETVRGVLDPLRLALAFLTILPLGPRRSVRPQSVGDSFAYFPIAGFTIGAALAAEDWLLGHALRPVLRSALLVLSLAIVTGGVHLDALADTADALGAGGDRDRALEILRDSSIGSFGAIALFFVLALKIIALAALAGTRRYAALILAPGLARWAMVAVSHRLEYLRAQGAGSSILKSDGSRNAAFATATTIVAALILPSARTLGACVAAAVAVFGMRAFYRRWLGGVTGDLVGAAGELVETIALLAMSA